MKKVCDVEGIPFALSHRGKHRRLLKAYEEAKREEVPPRMKYTVENGELVLTLTDTGTHADLF